MTTMIRDFRKKRKEIIVIIITVIVLGIFLNIIANFLFNLLPIWGIVIIGFAIILVSVGLFYIYLSDLPELTDSYEIEICYVKGKNKIEVKGLSEYCFGNSFWVVFQEPRIYNKYERLFQSKRNNSRLFDRINNFNSDLILYVLLEDIFGNAIDFFDHKTEEEPEIVSKNDILNKICGNKRLNYIVKTLGDKSNKLPKDVILNFEKINSADKKLILESMYGKLVFSIKWHFGSSWNKNSGITEYDGIFEVGKNQEYMNFGYEIEASIKPNKWSVIDKNAELFYDFVDYILNNLKKSFDLKEVKRDILFRRIKDISINQKKILRMLK